VSAGVAHPIIYWAHPLLYWALPPACGAVLGFLLGSLVFGPITRWVLRQRRGAISRAAAAQAGDLGSSILGIRAASVLPAEGSESASRLLGALQGILAGIMGSRGTIYAVREAVEKLVAGLASRSLGEAARAIALEKFLSETLLLSLSAPRARTAIAAAAGRLVSESSGSGISDETLAELAEVARSALPQAADAVVRWLRSPETRSNLSERGRELLPRILEKLSDLQKLFLTAAQFDRRLD